MTLAGLYGARKRGSGDPIQTNATRCVVSWLLTSVVSPAVTSTNMSRPSSRAQEALGFFFAPPVTASILALSDGSSNSPN